MRMTCPFGSRASSQLQPQGPSAGSSSWEHSSLAPSSSAPPIFWIPPPTDKTEGAVSLKILEDIKAQSGHLQDPLTESSGAGRDVPSLLRKAAIQHWHHVGSASIAHSGIADDMQGVGGGTWESISSGNSSDICGQGPNREKMAPNSVSEEYEGPFTKMWAVLRAHRASRSRKTLPLLGLRTQVRNWLEYGSHGKSYSLS